MADQTAGPHDRRLCHGSPIWGSNAGALRITSKGGEIVWSGSIFPGYLKSCERIFSIFLKVVTRMPNKMNQAASAALKLYSKVPNLHNKKRRQFWNKSFDHQRTLKYSLQYSLDHSFFTTCICWAMNDRPGTPPLNIHWGPQADQLAASQNGSPRQIRQQNAKLMILYSTHSMHVQTMRKTVRAFLTGWFCNMTAWDFDRLGHQALQYPG